MALSTPQSISSIRPPSLKPGDKVRFVSPASTPQREAVLQSAERLEEWGLRFHARITALSFDLGLIVNAGVKMHRCAGVKMHQA